MILFTPELIAPPPIRVVCQFPDSSLISCSRSLHSMQRITSSSSFVSHPERDSIFDELSQVPLAPCISLGALAGSSCIPALT